MRRLPNQHEPLNGIVIIVKAEPLPRAVRDCDLLSLSNEVHAEICRPPSGIPKCGRTWKKSFYFADRARSNSTPAKHAASPNQFAPGPGHERQARGRRDDPVPRLDRRRGAGREADRLIRIGQPRRRCLRVHAPHAHDFAAQPCTEFAAPQCTAGVAEIAQLLCLRFRCREVPICFTARHTTTHRADHGLPTWWTFPIPA